MHDFSPLSAAIGGVLIASSLALMLIGTGRIAGLSGVFAGVLRAKLDWRLWFVVGMFGAGIAFRVMRPETYDYGARVPLWAVAMSGLLVGVGTRTSNGCTSGHGLCGMSRLSKRSIIATMVFFAFGVITATTIGRLL